MDTLKDESNAVKHNDFMFYGTFKNAVDMVRRTDENAAGRLCMAIFRLGVRQEWTPDLPLEQRGFLKSIEPLIQRSQEKKEETTEARKRAKAHYKRTQKKSTPPATREAEST